MLKEMLKFIILITLCIGLGSAQRAAASNEKIKVLVLYESLCPDSVRFMHQQLRTSYDDLKDFVDIKLVPFGKSQSLNNGGQFFCQHGPAECEGNRMQSCVLAQTPDQAAQVSFAICQMTVPDKSSVQYCAEAAGLSANIQQCMSTTTGTALQLEAERITQTYAPTFVPTIVYDNVFDQQLQDNSIRNFRGTVCSLLQKRGVHSAAACQ